MVCDVIDLLKCCFVEDLDDCGDVVMVIFFGVGGLCVDVECGLN